ncbi:Eco57I restriction-modification methylase domain-containing protein [Microcoleus sp. SVA1_A1]|uniref:Eco57I restriction-modification methylase domain-containing protein n=1 Tax=Microcoleus sp. SVA1_A1 TaxID=2818946 RepID=UPI002FD2AFE0
MVERILQMDDINLAIDPARVMEIFRKLGYEILGQAIAIADLELSSQSTADIYEAHLIADQRSRNRALADLQVLLITLKPEVWESASVASGRMKAIATSLAKNKSDNYLLIGTNQQHDRLLLVNPRKSLDAQGNVRVSIHKLLIDRANPTAHDRERLEAIAVRHLDPQQLYKAHCEAFDVEKLTKRFYNEYRQLFERVQQVIKDHNAHPYFADAARLHQFSQRLLGRIMFLYFLQKKEFLAGDRRFLSHEYDRLKSQPEATNYYSELLEPLFFATLNQERPEQSSPWGKIPYLNGGLFDRDYGENIRDAAGRETPRTITLPNSLFDPKEKSNSILGFFNGYNFTVSENVQGDEDVAVDPEMLGKVFENMLEAEERGKSGTFYTPRGIVNFMCTEVLSRYLAQETGMNPEAIRELIELDPDLSDRDFNQKISPTQARELKRAIASVKILDPAVGSGAFPLGMMQVILAVRQAVGRREGAMIRRGSLAMSEVKREIIANNLYGVDIKPEAIEVAKLRMWLSLVVDIPSIEDVEALPNLDYKLMCGDSLISTIHGEQLIPDPTKTQQGMLAVTPIQEAIQPLLALQQSYYNADTDTRRDLRQQIIDAEANIFRVAVSDRLNFWQGEQRKLEQDIKRLGKSSRIQEKKRVEIAAKIAELGKFSQEVEQGERSLSFFSYHLHFRDVFEQRGGFDLVVGNPPYVRQEQFKELKPALEKEFDCYTGTADIFVYFFERGFRLLKEGGHLTYITSNKYFRSGYGEKLRKFLGEQATIQTLIDFGDAAVFEAIAYPSIVVFSKDNPTAETQTQVLTWEQTQLLEEFPKIFKSQSFQMPQAALKPDGWRIESPSVLALLEKLRRAGTPLGEYVKGRFYYGIKTGFNEAFVVDRETRDRLIAEHPSSAEVLKPFLRGRDVKRWCVESVDLYLLFIPWHFPLHQDSSISGVSTNAEQEFKKLYPAIYNHLLKFKAELSARNKAEIGIRYEWYALQRYGSTYWKNFEQPKIIYPNICKRNEFAWDESGYYTNQKAFIIPCNDKALLAILNSGVVTFLFDKLLAKLQGDFYEPSSIFMKDFPIPIATEPEKKAIETLVNYVLYLTTALKDIPSQGEALRESSMDKLMNSYFEQIIDALVTELYLPEELHSHDRYFMRYVLTENLPNLEEIKGDKMAGLREIFERLFEKDHPLRVGIFFLDSVPAVRVIRGLK